MLFPLLRDAVRLAFYTLVAGPALLLYVMALIVVQDGSPSQQFLSAARRLTEGAPAGKVMQCVTPEPERNVVLHAKDAGSPTWTPPVPDDLADHPRPSPPIIQFCHMEPVDRTFWTRPADQLVTILWLAGALLGAAWAFMTQRLPQPAPATFNRSVLHKKD
ncbi:hypothetical protein CIAM_44640 (plasmid) [Citrobacter amalonaticus]|nr:hypothetical protein CIAM_44640 [Citrobacter amalonaticus]